MTESASHASQQPTALDEAQIEALARHFGMTPEWTERLQLLREDVHATLNDEFQGVAGDLDQLRGMLGDAAQKLSSAFRTITSGTGEIQVAITGMPDGADAEAVGRLAQIVVGMASSTGVTVQSLQFEDMANQLLQHVHRRLTILQAFSKDMAILHPTSDHVPPLLGAADLDRLSETLARYREQLSVATRKVVQQQSLESGDIELF